MRRTIAEGKPRLNRIGLVAGLVMLGLAAAVGYWLLRPSPVRQGEPDVLTVAERYLDFGDAWEQEALHLTLPIENCMSREIEIDKFVTSCSCAGLEPRSLVVPGGQAANLYLTFNLNARTAQEAEVTEQPFSVHLTPQGQDNARLGDGWTIHGRVRSAFTFSPQVLDFDSTVVCGQPGPSREAVLAARTPLTKFTATCDDTLASVRMEPLKGSADKYRLEIVPRDSMPPGPFAFDITLKAVTSAGTTAIVRLPVQGTAQEDLQFTPSPVLFGVQTIGQTAAETVVLASRSRQPFEVTGIELSSDETAVEPIASTVGKAFRLTQRIARPAAQANTVKFLVTRNKAAPATLTLDVSYYGTQISLAR